MSARRLPGLALLALVLAAATFLPMLGAPEAIHPASARSSEPTGRRALFLLLAELGLEPELWERPPGELAGDPAGILWLPRSPLAFDPDAAEGDPLERSRARGPRAWRHYREFAAAGGALLLPATEASAGFLTRGLGLAEAGTEPFEADTVAFEGSFTRRDTAAGVELLGSDGTLLARELPLGEGAVVLVAGGEWLDNAQLERLAPALALVRLVERYAGSGTERAPVRFDEWALADRPRDGSALSLAFGPGRFPTWHLLALLALLAWAALGEREFPRDPEADAALAPLLRASAGAAFLARHGRYDALAAMLREGTAERLGGKPGGPQAPWTEALASRKVGDLDGLVALDRDLRSLEPQTGAGMRAASE